jgi:hypothetical protein
MSETFDLDALEVEGEDAEPFTFTYKGEKFSMPTAQAMPWQDQVALETATEAESLRLILGAEQYDRLAKLPMSAARMGKLITAWTKYQGLKPGE